MADRRELALVKNATPCEVNYFDGTLLTRQQALQRGREQCPNYEECNRIPRYCALRYGTDVARYVMQGGTLISELYEFSQAPDIDFYRLFWTSQDRENFVLVRKKPQVIRAVERFARIVLLQGPDESVFEICSTCDGAKLAKTVIDSGRKDRATSLSGSGKTKKRNVLYCPNCEPEPRGGRFEETLDLF